MGKQKQDTSWQHNRRNKVLQATKRGIATPGMGALRQAKQYGGDQLHALSTSAVRVGTILPIPNDAMACIFSTTHQ
eukprot:15353173-Ditylum_brightwellii.AAC.1